MRVTDPATLALYRLNDSSDCITRSAKSGYTNIPASTLWHRANGRQSKEEKAENQRYLTDPEEKPLKDFVLRFAKMAFLCRSSTYDCLPTLLSISGLPHP